MVACVVRRAALELAAGAVCRAARLLDDPRAILNHH
jgi:hypothetical protein